MAKGGCIEKGIDLFEDYDNIPNNVQSILDKYSSSFEDGEYKGLENALKELNKIGYTFDYDLEGQAYDLRKTSQKGKSSYANGGGVMEKKYAIYELAFGQPYNFYNEEQDKFIWSEPTKATLFTKKEAENKRAELLKPRIEHYQSTGKHYRELHIGDLFEKGILKKYAKGGGVDSHYEKMIKDNWENISYAWETGGKKVPNSISNNDAEDFLNDFDSNFSNMNEEEQSKAITKFKNAFKAVRTTKMENGGAMNETFPDIDAMSYAKGGGVGSNKKISEAIDDIVKYATLPHQIDYVKPYKTKHDKAYAYLESLPNGKKYIDRAHKKIEEYHESGSAYYDSLFNNGGGVEDSFKDFKYKDGRQVKKGDFIQLPYSKYGFHPQQDSIIEKYEVIRVDDTYRTPRLIVSQNGDIQELTADMVSQYMPYNRMAKGGAVGSSKSYYNEFAKELGKLIGGEVELESVSNEKNSREIEFILPSGANLQLMQDWSNDGTPNKPVTEIHIYPDTYIKLGRFGIPHNATEYANDIYEQIKDEEYAKGGGVYQDWEDVIYKDKRYKNWISKLDKKTNKVIGEKNVVYLPYQDVFRVYKYAKGGGVSKKIVVNTYKGKVKYTNQEIQEMIDDIDMYWSADNLPSWLYETGSVGHPDFPKNKKQVIDVLKEIKNSKNDVYINVSSKEPYYTHIIKMADGGGVGNTDTDVTVKQFLIYFQKNYGYISHSLSSKQIEKFLNQPTIKRVSLQKKADYFQDYLLANGLTDDVQLMEGGGLKKDDAWILDEMSAYDSFEDFYKGIVNYQKNAYEQYGEEVGQLEYTKNELKSIWDKNSQSNKMAKGGGVNDTKYKKLKSLIENKKYNEAVDYYLNNANITSDFVGSDVWAKLKKENNFKEFEKRYNNDDRVGMHHDSYAKGGGVGDTNWVVEFHGKKNNQTKVVRVNAKNNSDAIDKAFRKLSDMGENTDEYSVWYSHKSNYSNGGGVGKKSILNELLQLKKDGVKNISLNGFTEHIDYVINLKLDDSQISKVDEKSYITLYAKGGGVGSQFEYTIGGL